MKPLLEKYLLLEPNSSSSSKLFTERQKDHYSHFILRLAFASTEDLRRRFSRVETMLFRLRLNDENLSEKNSFIQTVNLDCEQVTEDERNKYREELAAVTGTKKGNEEETWIKVDWERVPDLVESRRVFVRAGKAYVPSKEQSSMVIAEFTKRLDRALEVSVLYPNLRRVAIILTWF
jgi:DNA primase large subunit